MLFSHRDKSHRKIMTYISRRRAEKYFHSLLSARTCEVVFACGGIVRENNLWLFRIFVRKKTPTIMSGSRAVPRHLVSGARRTEEDLRLEFGHVCRVLRRERRKCSTRQCRLRSPSCVLCDPPCVKVLMLA